ncbi:MAG: penicillin-binding protein [Patescibacteria group bacterium]
MYQPPRKSIFFRRRKKVAGTYFGYSNKKGLLRLPGFLQDVSWKKATIYTVLVFVLLTATLFAWFSRDLPNPYKINNQTAVQSSKIVDRNGKLLYEIHGEEKRTLVKFEDIPDSVKKATIALEDQEFYKHSGFNLKGILRAAIFNIFNRDSTQGGSTITQQYVKRALLTSDQVISRKIKELILSIEMERIYNKNEIFSLYLNEIPYGNNAYGVEAASKTYFNKDVKDVSLAEAALLAALPQAPTYYNPYGSNTDALMRRKDYALDQMVSLDLITKDEAEAAKKEVIKFEAKDTGILAPHFVMYVREKLAEQYGEQRLEEGGLIVTTTLDLDKQKIAEESVTAAVKNINALGAKNASLVSMDPKTGEVLAMVGSVDYFNTENDGNVNVATRLRQPGSSLKPIIYAALFDKGYAPTTMLMDVETDFGNYKPQNYDGHFRGPVTVRRALQNSLNIPAVEALNLVGVDEAASLARKMGLTSLTDPQRYGLSLVLGGGDVKLLELANAYSAFATYGMHTDPVSILKIEDGSGKSLYEYKADEHKPVRVLDENVAFLTANVLSDDAARAEIFGLGGPLTLPGRPVAVKTGTTDEYRDAWTVGYTPSVVTGVWVGNNDNSPMVRGGGAMAAAPIWNSYMRKVLAGTPVEQFNITPGITTVKIDALTGKLPLENIPPELADKLPIVDAYFIKGKEPTTHDDVHKIVRVVKVPEGQPLKLADDKCPVDLTENKIFFEYHSILPNYKPWEDAVTNWAKAAGLNNVPTEKSDCSDLAKDRPTISITSQATDLVKDGKLFVTVSVIAPKDIAKVEYFLGEEKIGEVAVTPYNLEGLPLPSTLKGKFTLKAIVTDKAGITAVNEKAFSL